MCKINYLLGILLLVLVSACGDDNSDKKVDSIFFGETNAYSDFLFYKYEPVRMTRTVVFEFNEDAQRSRKEVRLGLFDKDEKGRLRPVKNEVVFYKNGDRCEDNVFTVVPGEQPVEVGLEFTPDADFGVHKWYIKVIDNGELDRINEYEMEEDPSPVLLEWKVKKIDSWNPLKLILMWILIILLGLLLLWLLLLKKMFYPTFKVGTMVITDPYYSMRKLKGCYKLVCTNKAVKQSALSRLFVGQVAYEVNAVWTDEWVIMPRDTSSIKPTGQRNYAFEPFTVSLKKGVEYVVTNNTTGEKIKLIIN